MSDVGEIGSFYRDSVLMVFWFSGCSAWTLTALRNLTTNVCTGLQRSHQVRPVGQQGVQYRGDLQSFNLTCCCCWTVVASLFSNAANISSAISWLNPLSSARTAPWYWTPCRQANIWRLLISDAAFGSTRATFLSNINSHQRHDMFLPNVTPDFTDEPSVSWGL